MTPATIPRILPSLMGEGPRYDNPDGPSKTPLVAIGHRPAEGPMGPATHIPIGWPRAGRRSGTARAPSHQGGVCSISPLPVGGPTRVTKHPRVDADRGRPAGRLSWSSNRGRMKARSSPARMRRRPAKVGDSRAARGAAALVAEGDERHKVVRKRGLEPPPGCPDRPREGGGLTRLPWRGIPPGGVARRSRIPDTLAPRALPAGRPATGFGQDRRLPGDRS